MWETAVTWWRDEAVGGRLSGRGEVLEWGALESAKTLGLTERLACHEPDHHTNTFSTTSFLFDLL